MAQKRAALKAITLLLIILLICILLIPVYVYYQTKKHIYTATTEVPKTEIAIVLGAAIKNNTTPGGYLQNRLDDALMLYNNGTVKKILLSGDNGNDAHDEITTMTIT